MRPATFSLTVAALLLATACTSDGSRGSSAASRSRADSGARAIKIAFVDDLSPDDAAKRVEPAFQGVRLAIQDAIVSGRLPDGATLVPLDTQGDPATIRDVADEIASDSAFVAAVGAPGLTGQLVLGRALAAAGVTFITLSSLEPDLASEGWTTWRRAVAPIGDVGAALAAAAAQGQTADVCLVDDGEPTSVALLAAVERHLGAQPAVTFHVPIDDPAASPTVAAVRRAGCHSAVWGGSGLGGGQLRLALTAAGLGGVRLFGGDALKAADYIVTAAGAGRGTVVACPCVDLTTSTRLDAQRFIQDFQSQFALAPGPFAVEAWDMTRMVLATVEAGAVTRGAVAEALSGVGTYQGLVGTYRFASDGELEDAAASVRLYRDDGPRWVAVTGT